MSFLRLFGMTHAVFSRLLSEIKRGRQSCEADGKVAEVEGWLGRKGWQQRSLKMCCFSVTWRRPCHSGFFFLITHLSLRYTARRQGCWQDCDTDRKRKKEEGESGVCALNNSIWLVQFIYSLPVCALLFRVTGNLLPSLLILFFSLSVSAHPC